MRLSRALRAVLVAATALSLVACAGLPTSGPVNVGLALGDDGDVPDFAQLASGPMPGANPREIVSGFLLAAITPADDWATAREFLTEDLRDDWKPQAGVTIDSTVSSRVIDADVDEESEEAEDATAAAVRVQLDQVAELDGTGAYSEATGTARTAFRLVREKGGEWRISEAQDGIVLDADSFSRAYKKHALQYFDQSWTHLVPDVRWFPAAWPTAADARRGSMATVITRALVAGEPSPWLAPAVRSAFVGDVALARDAVPVDSSQVAEVALTRAALSASGQALARMRTQLEASLAGLGVSEVRFTVDGTTLEANRVALDPPADSGVLVLTDDTFGSTRGVEVSPLSGITAQIAKITEPIAAIDVAADGGMAAVQLTDGRVLAVSDGDTVVLDERAGLVAPSVDPFGFTWSVPRDRPSELSAWNREVEANRVAQAWPDAGSISHLRVSSDGARVAAVLSEGGQRRLVVAAVIRGEDGVPSQLGEVRDVARIAGTVQGLAWQGVDALLVLSAATDPLLTTHIVGGPATAITAPDGALAINGARSADGVRVLGSDGVLYAQRGSSWQEWLTGVRVLATRAGY